MPLFLYGVVLNSVGGVEVKQRQSLLEMESLPRHIFIASRHGILPGIAKERERASSIAEQALGLHTLVSDQSELNESRKTMKT